MLVKIHESYISIIAICDSDLIGKTFEEGKKNIFVNPNFFQGDGAAISFVSPLSPAEKAGLRIGDVITQFNGKRVQNASQLRSIIASRQPNETVSIDLWRADE